MGQKTNPVGLRLGITRTWVSNWFAKERFPDYLYEDMLIRNYLRKRLEHGGISILEIERTAKRVTVGIHTSTGHCDGKGKRWRGSRVSCSILLRKRYRST